MQASTPAHCAEQAGLASRVRLGFAARRHRKLARALDWRLVRQRARRRNGPVSRRTCTARPAQSGLAVDNRALRRTPRPRPAQPRPSLSPKGPRSPARRSLLEGTRAEISRGGGRGAGAGSMRTGGHAARLAEAHSILRSITPSSRFSSLSTRQRLTFTLTQACAVTLRRVLSRSCIKKWASLGHK